MGIDAGGNPKSMQAWDGVKYLGQLYAYAETSQRARELAGKRFYPGKQTSSKPVGTSQKCRVEV